MFSLSCTQRFWEYWRVISIVPSSLRPTRCSAISSLPEKLHQGHFMKNSSWSRKIDLFHLKIPLFFITNKSNTTAESAAERQVIMNHRIHRKPYLLIQSFISVTWFFLRFLITSGPNPKARPPSLVHSDTPSFFLKTTYSLLYTWCNPLNSPIYLISPLKTPSKCARALLIVQPLVAFIFPRTFLPLRQSLN